MAKKDKIEFIDEVVVLGDTPPNIAYVGKGEDVKPLERINAPGVKIILPADQSQPFYLEQADFVIRQFPYLYKHVKEKGA